MTVALKAAAWIAAYITAAFGVIGMCVTGALYGRGDYSAGAFVLGVTSLSALVTSLRTQRGRVPHEG